MSFVGGFGGVGGAGGGGGEFDTETLLHEWRGDQGDAVTELIYDHGQAFDLDYQEIIVRGHTQRISGDSATTQYVYPLNSALAITGTKYKKIIDNGAATTSDNAHVLASSSWNYQGWLAEIRITIPDASEFAAGTYNRSSLNRCPFQHMIFGYESAAISANEYGSWVLTPSDFQGIRIYSPTVGFRGGLWQVIGVKRGTAS